MNSTKCMVAFASVLLLGFFVLAGCERRTNSSPKATNMTWTNLLQTSRATILNGSWEQAETCWADLKKERRNVNYLQQWIQLQVDILEKTESDPLKNELRLEAIQEMYFETEASRQHLPWLKKSIETGLFKEQGVQQKAQELLHDLQAGGR